MWTVLHVILALRLECFLESLLELTSSNTFHLPYSRLQYFVFIPSYDDDADDDDDDRVALMRPWLRRYSEPFQALLCIVCNNLPPRVTSAESLSTFHQMLKTHLLSKSFPAIN